MDKYYSGGFTKISIAIIIVIVIIGSTMGYFLIKNKIFSLQDTESSGISKSLNDSDNQDTLKTDEVIVKNMSHIVTIETSIGTLKFATFDQDAPNTVNNFIQLANKSFYDGVIFHRVIPGFMIQTGDPLGNGTGGPGYKFNDELNPETESYKNGYKKGVVAMANAGPNTNGSQFFIMVADYPLPNNYTIFGKIISGQDVADKISKVKRSSNDRPLIEVVMKKVTVDTNSEDKPAN